jgi:glycosyltransferase involved in cell wall biosynthesis
VLESFPSPRPTSVNPYTLLLAESIAAQGATLLHFDWRTALTGNYDVFHVHWPEILVTGRTPFRQFARQALTWLFIQRLRLTHTAVVRTVHNLGTPSGLDASQSRLLAMLDRLTTLRVRLTEHTPVPHGSAFATIPHANFRSWFAAYPHSAIVRGQIGYIGRIRRYKGVEALLEAFAATRQAAVVTHGSLVDARLSARIAGYASSPELEAAIQAMASDDDRVSVEFGFVPDSAIVEIVTTSELVVLPYRLMHNSSAVITALSLDRPVLVPDNAVTRDLADEVGQGWVYTFDNELTPADILDALERHRAAPPAAPPHFDARSWKHSGAAHVAAFQRAVALRRGAR